MSIGEADTLFVFRCCDPKILLFRLLVLYSRYQIVTIL